MCCLFGRGFESLQLHITFKQSADFQWIVFVLNGVGPTSSPHILKTAKKLERLCAYFCAGFMILGYGGHSKRLN